MRKLCVVLMALVCLGGMVEAGHVRGYYRRDGTYVRPHYRSNPDSSTENNFGRASYEQRKENATSSVLRADKNDYDNDGIANKVDTDDDNDGIRDKDDAKPYGDDD